TPRRHQGPPPRGRPNTEPRWGTRPAATRQLLSLRHPILTHAGQIALAGRSARGAPGCLTLVDQELVLGTVRRELDRPVIGRDGLGRSPGAHQEVGARSME